MNQQAVFEQITKPSSEYARGRLKFRQAYSGPLFATMLETRLRTSVLGRWVVAVASDCSRVAAARSAGDRVKGLA